MGAWTLEERQRIRCGFMGGCREGMGGHRRRRVGMGEVGYTGDVEAEEMGMWVWNMRDDPENMKSSLRDLFVYYYLL